MKNLTLSQLSADFFFYIEKTYNIDLLKLQKLIDKQKEIIIPYEIIKNRKLGSFESIVKYLIENRNLSLKEISLLTGRNNKTIWSVYNKSKIKHKTMFKVDNSNGFPINILHKRIFSVLENIVQYMVQNNYSILQISNIINRAPNTIRTVISRYMKK